jgi:hypothetical protein
VSLGARADILFPIQVGAPEGVSFPKPFMGCLRAFRARPWLVVAISIVVLLPCLWHHRIEAGDLGSHTYNAWLAQLIARGRAPGLYIVQQWNNVLADLLLAHLGSVVGLQTAEKIVVSSSVLVFFWGAFALMSAASRRLPWSLTPAIAMVTYGWTFHMGFLNYYLSLGLSFLAIALLWGANKPHTWLLGLLLSVLALIAHPIGFLWLVGTVAYVRLSESTTGRVRSMLFPLALLVILAVHFYIPRHYRTFAPVRWSFYRFTGPDQLLVFGYRYRLLALAFVVLVAGIAVLGVIDGFREIEFWRTLRVPLELCLLVVFATAMLWGAISSYAMSLTYLSPRISSVTAILLLCFLACMQPRTWHLAALSVCAAIFFLLLYQDTATINHMEAAAENLLDTLPAESRVVATIWPLPGWRVGVDHIFDRACIGRCFAYSNYEPSTREFRIRVTPGSPVVVAAAGTGLAMREGRYLVQPEDLPLWQLYQCDEKDLTHLCLRSLSAGEFNGRLGYHPTYFNLSDGFWRQSPK